MLVDLARVRREDRLCSFYRFPTSQISTNGMRRVIFEDGSTSSPPHSSCQHHLDAMVGKQTGRFLCSINRSGVACAHKDSRRETYLEAVYRVSSGWSSYLLWRGKRVSAEPFSSTSRLMLHPSREKDWRRILVE